MYEFHLCSFSASIYNLKVSYRSYVLRFWKIVYGFNIAVSILLRQVPGCFVVAVHLYITFFIWQLPFIGQSSFFLQFHDGIDLGFSLLAQLLYCFIIWRKFSKQLQLTFMSLQKIILPLTRIKRSYQTIDENLYQNDIMRTNSFANYKAND